MIDKEEFKEYILAGKTIPELQKIYTLSRSKVAQYKQEYGFVGLTPNSKKRNIEEGTKTCNMCDETFSLTAFYSNGTTPSGTLKYKAACKQCENTKRSANFTTKILDYIKSCNKTYNCEKCNYTGIWGSLDFHHVIPGDKLFNIGDYSNKALSEEAFERDLVPELDKCMILCPNCHRQEHLFMGRK